MHLILEVKIASLLQKETTKSLAVYEGGSLSVLLLFSFSNLFVNSLQLDMVLG